MNDGIVSAEAAHRLLGHVLYPRFPRALFGMDQLAKGFDREHLTPDFDLRPIQRAVMTLIESGKTLMLRRRDGQARYNEEVTNLHPVRNYQWH